jgi:hypothetical protein
MSTHPDNKELEKCKQECVDAACNYFRSTTNINVNVINIDVINHLEYAVAAYLTDPTMPGLSKKKREKKKQIKLLLEAYSAYSKAVALYNTIYMN